MKMPGTNVLRPAGERSVLARSGREEAKGGNFFELPLRSRTCCGPGRPVLRDSSPRRRTGSRDARGYMLTELLVYIGLVVVVLGLAYAVMYRCVDNAVVLRRNVEDVAAAMRAGELWRADVRRSDTPAVVIDPEGVQWITLQGGKGEVRYRFETNAVSRKLSDQPWVRVLDHVNTSRMQKEPRGRVTAWTWEVELLPRAKGYNKPGRVRPLFTFIAVPEKGVTK
jgi:hypothetical protein